MIDLQQDQLNNIAELAQAQLPAEKIVEGIRQELARQNIKQDTLVSLEVGSPSHFLPLAEFATRYAAIPEEKGYHPELRFAMELLKGQGISSDFLGFDNVETLQYLLKTSAGFQVLDINKRASEAFQEAMQNEQYKIEILYSTTLDNIVLNCECKEVVHFLSSKCGAFTYFEKSNAGATGVLSISSAEVILPELGEKLFNVLMGSVHG